MLDIVAACLLITAVLAYLNHRFLGLPTTIGVMAAAFGLSFGVVGLRALGIGHGLRIADENFVLWIRFGKVLLQGMHSMWLFAGAMRANLGKLRSFRGHVMALALWSTAAPTLVVDLSLWFAHPLIGVRTGLPWCLFFGALISPTDPVGDEHDEVR